MTLYRGARGKERGKGLDSNHKARVLGSSNRLGFTVRAAAAAAAAG